MSARFTPVRLGVITALLGGTLASTAHALPWRYESTVEVGGLYTDNVNRTASDTEDSVIATARPELSAKLDGVTTDVKAIAALDLFQSGDGETGSAVPTLGVETISAVRDNQLQLETAAQVTQIADVGAGDAGTYLALGDDFEQLYSLTLAPSFRRDIGRAARFTSRYRFDGSTASGSAGQDTTDHLLDVALDKPLDDTRYLWGAQGSYRHSSVSDDETLVVQNVLLKGGRSLSEKVIVEVSGGVESTELRSSAGTAALDPDGDFNRSGTIGDVGIRWTPSSRTSVFASYGRRLFGDRPAVQWRHERRSSIWQLDWSRDFTRVRPALDTDDSVVVFDAGGGTRPLTESTDPTVTALQQYLVVDERIEASVTLRGRVSTVKLALLRSEQEPVSAARPDTLTHIASLVFARRLSPVVTVGMSLEHLAERIGDAATIDENRIAATVKFRL